MRYVITSQLICHNSPRFPAIPLHQPLEKAFSGLSVPPGLQKNIDNLSVLVHSPPQMVLLSLNPDKHLINKEGVTVALPACPAIDTTPRSLTDTPNILDLPKECIANSSLKVDTNFTGRAPGAFRGSLGRVNLSFLTDVSIFA